MSNLSNYSITFLKEGVLPKLSTLVVQRYFLVTLTGKSGSLEPPPPRGLMSIVVRRIVSVLVVRRTVQVNRIDSNGDMSSSTRRLSPHDHVVIFIHTSRIFQDRFLLLVILLLFQQLMFSFIFFKVKTFKVQTSKKLKDQLSQRKLSEALIIEQVLEGPPTMKFNPRVNNSRRKCLPQSFKKLINNIQDF